MGYVIVAHDAQNNNKLHVFGNRNGGEYSTESAAVEGRGELWGLTGPGRYTDAVVVLVEKGLVVV